MFIALLSVTVALAMGHLAPALLARVRDQRWVAKALRRLDAQFPDDHFWRGRHGVALPLVPLLLLVGALQVLVSTHAFGLLALLLAVAALVYAWGPRDLDLDVADVISAQSEGDRLAAATHLWPPGEAVSLAPTALVEATVRCALRRWFSVLLWLLLLGPAGAIAYRFVAIFAEGVDAHLLPPDAVRGARRLLTLLDWPAAQLMTAAMALVGHFDGVVAAWKQAGGATLRADLGFVVAAAQASAHADAVRAADADDADVSMLRAGATPPEMVELRAAMRLLWRVLLVWLCVLAVLVLAGWVV